VRELSITTSHPEQGRSLLCNGTVLFKEARAAFRQPGINDPPGNPHAARRKDRRMNHVPCPPITCRKGNFEPSPKGNFDPSRAPTRTLLAQRPYTTQLELSAVSTAAGRARATVRAALAEWDLAALTDDAEAITSELVANAIAASQQAAPAGTMPAPVWLTITVTTELFIDVWDPCPDPPPTDYVPGTWDEYGRGLLIINTLCHRWGWCHPNGHGKVVWAALSTGQ
jgi:anti-sigma regulatory factor (Ser/Thr protein kinase)